MVVPLTDVGMTGEEMGLRENQEVCRQHAQRDQLGILYESGAQRRDLGGCHRYMYIAF